MYIAIVLAFVMTLITASSNIFLKKGFLRISPFTVSYISVLISTVFLWFLVILFVPKHYFSNYIGILIFVLIGSFAPTFVRTFTYYGIHTLGAGRSAPLRAMTPFFAVIMAILFLKETPKPYIFGGILLIAWGIFVSVDEKFSNRDYRRIHFLYPLSAALLAGVAANLRKFGLNIMPQPVFASAIAATSSFFFLTLYMLFNIKKHRADLSKAFGYRKEFIYILIAALLTTAGEITDLSALLFGRVSLVIPIFATTPLMIIILSKIFLKEHEKITKRIFISALLTILGIYISIYSAR